MFNFLVVYQVDHQTSININFLFEKPQVIPVTVKLVIATNSKLGIHRLSIPLTELQLSLQSATQVL
jgi:hypothetical protein